MKCFIFFILIILVSSSFACPSSKWFRFGSKCFLSHCCLKFQDSVNFCQSLSATTVSILSEEENNFLTTKLPVNKGHWLGIRQVDFDNKTYEWLNGSPYKYSNWNLRFQNNCSGAFIIDGKWVDDTQSCDQRGYAFCQMEIYSTIFKKLSQIVLVTGNLNKEIKQVETRLKSTDDNLEDALETQKDLLTAMSSKFQSDLENTETRLSKSIEKLEDKMNLMNLSMSVKDSDFELDLKKKDIQVYNMNKELIGLRLVNKR